MHGSVRSIVEVHLGRGKASGDDFMLFRCPFHKDGQERKPSFSISLSTGHFGCFTCHESGSLSNLLRRLGLSDKEVDTELRGVREGLRQAGDLRRLQREAKRAHRDPYVAEVVLREAVLAEYKRKLPERLIEAGFNPDWLRYLDVGVDDRNSRIVYPIRDFYGNLAGASGGALHPGMVPKYKVYRGGYRDMGGVWRPGDFGEAFDEEYPGYRFENRNFLYNYDKVYPGLFYSPEKKYVVITEGYKACIWVLQSGIPYSVALMGSAMTALQYEQLLRTAVPIIFFLDNNEAGVKGTIRDGGKLHLRRENVYVARYPDQREQPDSLSQEEVHRAVLDAVPFHVFRNGLLYGLKDTEASCRSQTYDNHRTTSLPSAGGTAGEAVEEEGKGPPASLAPC